MPFIQIAFLIVVPVLGTVRGNDDDITVPLEYRVKLLEQQDILQAYKFSQDISRLEKLLKNTKIATPVSKSLGISSNDKERLTKMENTMNEFMDKITDKVDALTKGLIDEKKAQRQSKVSIQEEMGTLRSDFNVLQQRVDALEEKYKTEKESSVKELDNRLQEMIRNMTASISELQLMKNASSYRELVDKDPSKSQCQPGWFQIKNMCYFYVVDRPLDWHSASLKCYELGGSLAGPDNADAMDELFDAIKDNVWLGGTDEAKEGEWRWIGTNENISYDRWADSQPNSFRGEQDCLEVWSEGFNDEGCMVPNDYVCEKTPSN